MRNDNDGTDDGLTMPERDQANGEGADRLGDYRLLREVGRGGMGVVYEAIQESLGRRVALKVLSSKGSKDAVYLERFRREALAAARLHHTNIVPVYGVGEHGGRYFFAMQFIDGQSLDGVLREMKKITSTEQPQLTIQAVTSPGDIASPLDEKKDATTAAGVSPSLASSHLAETFLRAPQQFFRLVAQIGLQVADALHYAHEQGVVHRDIKPGNLMRDHNGVIWITDFGLAKSDKASDLTGTGEILGTFRYMPPERFRGVSDAGGDLYGLGLSLFELMTLQPAFDESDRMKLIEQIRTTEPPRPRQCNRAIPRDLETIVLKAIAKDPRERYANGAEMAEDLRHFLADRPIKARRLSAMERLWRWRRRNPALAAVTALAGLLLLLIAGGSTWAAFVFRAQRDLLHQQTTNLQQREQQLKQEKNRVVAAEYAKTKQLWHSLLAQARAGRWSGRVGRRFQSLQALAEAAAIKPSRELQSEAIACMGLRDVQLIEQIPGIALDESHMLAVDANLNYCAQNTGNNSIVVYRLPTKEKLAHLPGLMKLAAPRFSPDGRYVAVQHGNTANKRPALVIWNWATNKKVLELDGVVSFSFVQSDVLVKNRTAQAILYALPSGKVKREVLPRLPMNSIHPQPSGSLVATSRMNHAMIDLWDLQTNKVKSRLFATGRARFIAWSPDGKYLAAVDRNNMILVWENDNAKPVHTFAGQGQIDQLGFHPHEKILFTCSYYDVTKIWSFSRGEELLRLPGKLIRVSRDGSRFILHRNNQLEIWQLANAQELRRVPLPLPVTDGHPGVAFHPNGRLIATISKNGAWLWDSADLKSLGAIASGISYGAVFDASRATLLIGSRSGLHEWPSTTLNEAEPSGLQLGPPQTIVREFPCANLALSRDGNTLAFQQTGKLGTTYVYRRTNEKWKMLRELHGVHQSFTAVSPKGELIATGIWMGASVQIWETATGELVKSIPVDRVGACFFSPDEKWLLVSSRRGIQFFDCKTWSKGHRLDFADWSRYRWIAFSPRGEMLAVSRLNNKMQLWQTATGRLLAELEATPAPAQPSIWFSFNPDGDKLLVAHRDELLLWDLATIRRRLKTMHLDWPMPPFSARDARPQRPFRLQLSQGDLESIVLHRNAESLLANRRPDDALRHANKAVDVNPKAGANYLLRARIQLALTNELEAIADLKKYLSLKPATADDYDSAARLLLSAEKKSRLLLSQAKTWAQLATKTKKGKYHSTLGRIEYYADELAAARKNLHKAATDSGNSRRVESAFYLALVALKLRDLREAKNWYSKAVAHRNSNQAKVTNFADLRKTVAKKIGGALYLEYSLEEAQKRIALKPKDASAYYARASVLSGLRRVAEAERDLTRAIQLQPRYAQAYHLRGHCFENLNDYPKALADLSEATRLSPNATGYRDCAAWLRCIGPKSIRDPKTAAEFARKNVKTSPRSAKYQLTLGIALGLLGQHKESIEVLEKVDHRVLVLERRAFKNLSLARSYTQLDHRDEAKRRFSEAVLHAERIARPPGWFTERFGAWRLEVEKLLAKDPNAGR